MQKLFLAVSGLLAALGVMLGALGTHFLKPNISADQLQVFETGVKYHIYHSLALLIIAFFLQRLDLKFMIYAGYCFIAGIVFFSGSLYLLSTKNVIGLESTSWLGPFTPFGGLCFISGWICVFISALKMKK